MVPGSDVIEILNGDGLEPSVRYMAVASTADELVVPSSNGLVPDEMAHEDTENVLICSRRHVEMVHDPDVFGRYVDRLA